MNSDIPTLDERIERARALRAEGYNCSQCVFMVFDDIHSMSPDDAARMTAGLGGGVGGQHQVWNGFRHVDANRSVTFR